MVATYVINLDRSQDRLERFRRTNGGVIDFVRFPASDGLLLDRGLLRREGLIDETLRYTQGALGCAHSHISLWKLACSRGEALTIAEDDAIFSCHFNSRAGELMERAPWDIIQWGFNFDAFLWTEIPQFMSRAKVEFSQSDLVANMGAFQGANIVPTLIPLKHSFGTVAYSVSPEGARKLLEFCLPLRNELIEFLGYGVRIENTGIDAVMNKAYPFLRSFMAFPPLVITPNEKASSTVSLDPV